MTQLDDRSRPHQRRPRAGGRAIPATIACAVVFLLSCGGGGSAGNTSGGDGVPGTRPERLTLLLQNLGDRVIVPRYAAMTTAFADLDAATARFCAAPSAAGLASVQAAWRNGMDAWLAASIIQFGPIHDDNRRLRIQFWPDANNNVSRSVAQVLARDDELTPDSLAGQSVAAQGLTADESLLFDPAADVLASFSTAPGAARRCAFASAIAGNLKTIATGIESEWRRSGGGWVDQLARAGLGSDVFATREAAIEEVVNSLVTVIEVTKNNRIGDPLGGDTAASAKPFRAESYLSGNSLANVVSAIRGLQAAYGAGSEFGFDDYLRELDDLTLNAQIQNGFDTVAQQAAAIPLPLAQAVQDDASRAAVEELFANATTLTRLIKNQLSSTMQVTVGFNENDGD